MRFEDVFEVKELIGKGSFAEVKKCVNRRTSQLFAVKEIHFKNSDEREKVEQESEILGRLDHHSIVRLERVFYAEGKVLMVLEYLPGGDLFDGLVSRPFYSEKDACACVRQVILALNYLSKKRIIHRDLKPENLLLAEKPSGDRPPVIKLTDFGIAKTIEDGRQVVESDGSGSPMYLAPETILERPVNSAVDIWACGVILYLLLVGYPPFWSEKVEFLLLSILQGNYSFPSPYWDSVSESAKDLIRKMLTVNPDERISASEALRHEWIAQGDFVPSLHRRSTFVRLTAFNGRRKLRGVVLGLIARKRLTFTPCKNEVRLLRRDSYTPDPQLELEAEEILSHKEKEEEGQRLEKIEEEINGNKTSLSIPSTEYHVTDIKARRSRQFRSSVYMKVKGKDGKARARKTSSDDN
ncbi:calcium/calmodulin-dependent protein kinase type II subunit delta-like [Montipora capricornis]|uniref:calcium/calmodulin-dependent protein kinase type II subunit delta-like n=1 Tax=Montipora capricornis TaxID=246305 RepID=UPI0035F19949